MKYKLLLKYVYTFYNSGEIIYEDIFDEAVDVSPHEIRFKLHDQEDGSFTLSEICEDYLGKYVVVTFPNKDVVIVHEGESCELAYDEYYSAMGDDNHNVYVGTFSLLKE
jgi:hypothetical protein